MATGDFFTNHYTPQLIATFGSTANLGALAPTQQTFLQICASLESGNLTTDLAFNQFVAEIGNYCEVYDVVGSAAHDQCLADYFIALGTFAATGQ